ncbi:wd40 repeat protein [Anaeramoeba flamelloides]|uniref:Wd40 repeat protein n=1 Tax=Anaeramoeba flamelloides TaxID=1746091 RepID=A0AAV8A0J3_9EUKA|nr:wd40 repeat protein [Anaeramoeba flamelloides]
MNNQNIINKNKPKQLKVQNKNSDLHTSYIRCVFVDEENLYLSSFDNSFSKTPLNDINKRKSKKYQSHTKSLFEIRKRKGKDLLITCSSDEKIIATDPQSGKKVKEFVGFGGKIYQTVDYQNRIYGFGESKSKVIVCWNFETTKIIKTIQIQDTTMGGTLVEESGKIFAGTKSGMVLVIDAESNKIIKEFKAHDGSIMDMRNRDGIVYTSGGTKDPKIKSWDSTSYQQLKTYEGNEKGTVVFRIKWNYIISGGNTNTLKIFDLETTELLYTADLMSQCWGFDLNEKYIYAGSSSHLQWIKIENILETYSPSNNFLELLKNPKFSDFQIFDFPVHKFLISLRCSKEASEIKTILQNNFTKEETFKFLEWVYGKQFSFSSMNSIQKIFDKLEIHDLKTKTIQSDLIKAYSDEDSKDFSIIVKDQDDEDEDEDDDEFEEIKVHKFILFSKCGLFQDFFENIQQETNKVQDYSEKSIESIEHFIKYLYFNDLNLTADDDPQLIYEELEDAVEYYQLDKDSNLPNCLKKIKHQFNLI